MWSTERCSFILLCTLLLLISRSAFGEKTSCDPGQILCKNGICISSSWKCDGENDCGDRSDEDSCPPKQCKWLAEFQCKNGRCLPDSWACDQSDDCGDGSDESQTSGPMCPSNITCSSLDFKCARSQKCIRRAFLCDGNFDCDAGDTSDESNCGKNTCRSTEFRCASGNCVSKSFVCDRHRDCSDGSDERNCSSAACKDNEFKCVASGHCILKKYACDKHPDCIDGSDEVGCVSTTLATTTVGKRLVSDAAIVPTTKAATLRMSTPLRCPADHVKCGDEQRCIHRSWLCDGESDCANGEDESKERCAKVTCSPKEFTCANGRCIPANLRCDSMDQCGDNSDEKSCPTLRPVQCTQSTFRCGGKNHCVPMDAVCNGNEDCPGGDDESSLCGIDECKGDKHNCTGLCRDKKIGFECYCAPGYRLLSDNRTCVDIDECDNPGICSQHCVNLKGSFKCLCGDGYVLEPDQRRCRAKDPLPFLVFSNRFDIRRIGTSGQHYDELIKREHVRNAAALGIDIKDGHIYWADNINGTISRALVSKAHVVETIIFGGGGKIQGLAVDWVGRKLYWTTSFEASDAIEVANLDGSYRSPLITTGLDQPRALAIHPQRRILFWTSLGKNPSIESASMDGAARKVIITSQYLGFPMSLAIDHTTDRMFWVDSEKNYLGSSSLDGSDIKFIAQRLNRPFGLTVFEDYVYWTNYQGKQMFRANKFTGSGQKEFEGNFFAPMDIHVYHPLTQKSGLNPCDVRYAKNGGCSHLCLLSSVSNVGYACACPRNYKLMEDERKCVTDGVIPKPYQPGHGTGNECNAHQFHCRYFSKCIDQTKVCDGHVDCVAGEDESETMCGAVVVKHNAKVAGHSSNAALLGSIIGVVILITILLALGIYCAIRKRRNRFDLSIMYETENGLVAHGKTDKAPIIQFGQPMAQSHPVPAVGHSPNSKNFDNINYLETLNQDDDEDEGIQEEPSDEDNTSNSSYDETKPVIAIR